MFCKSTIIPATAPFAFGKNHRCGGSLLYTMEKRKKCADCTQKTQKACQTAVLWHKPRQERCQSLRRQPFFCKDMRQAAKKARKAADFLEQGADEAYWHWRFCAGRSLQKRWAVWHFGNQQKHHSTQQKNSLCAKRYSRIQRKSRLVWHRVPCAASQTTRKKPTRHRPCKTVPCWSQKKKQNEKIRSK